MILILKFKKLCWETGRKNYCVFWKYLQDVYYYSGHNWDKKLKSKSTLWQSDNI